MPANMFVLYWVLSYSRGASDASLSAPFAAVNGGGPQSHADPGTDSAASTHDDARGCTHVVRFYGRTLTPQAPPAPASPAPTTREERKERIEAATMALRSCGHVRMMRSAARDAEGNVLDMLVVCRYCDGAVFLQGTEHEFRRLIMLHVRACDTPGAQAAYARALDADKENSV